MAIVANPMLLLLIKNSLTAISLGAVRKNCHYAFATAQAFGNLVRRDGCGAGRPAAEQPFKFGHLLQRRANLVVLNHHDFVGKRSIKDLRNKILLSDALDLLWSRRS